jgi:sulfate-transporting ATPase
LIVQPGEVLGLIGPNGAGKTTLIDAVTGFARSTGAIRLNGREIGRWSPRRRARNGLGRTFQNLELFEAMTVRDNLRAASERRDALAYLTDLVRPGRSPLSPETLALVQEFALEDDLDRRPGDLPYGRRRLVGIARAVAMRPSVLLLDEPAAGLDDAETEELGRLIVRLANEWGLAVLLVEHDVSLVLSVCDRVAVLDQGKQLASGTPSEITEDPAVISAYLGPSPSTDVLTEQLAATDTPIEVNGATAPLVEVRGLSAGYGDLAAVHDLTFSVQAGEIVALLGPNGAGKTTTLLALAGELPALAGEARVLGLGPRLSLARRARHGLAFVPEERGVINALTCQGNLRLGRGGGTAAVELFPELLPLLHRRAGLLSGGEQQMLALGRALAAAPRLLLVDELSLGLAPMIVERLLNVLRIAADDGAAVVLVEQHASEVLRVADRAVVLRRGRIEMSANAAELLGNREQLKAAYLTGHEPISTNSNLIPQST